MVTPIPLKVPLLALPTKFRALVPLSEPPDNSLRRGRRLMKPAEPFGPGRLIPPPVAWNHTSSPGYASGFQGIGGYGWGPATTPRFYGWATAAIASSQPIS